MNFDRWVNDRLLAHGAYSGRVDGVPGREMVAALKRFQAAVGLEPTGLANAATVDALRQNARGVVVAVAPKVPAEPVWMREARRYMGLREVAGPKSNSTIIGWARRLGSWVADFYTNDDTPWCGLAVANWISVTLPSEPLPSNPLGALNWSNVGIALKEPALGAILTFKRPGGGHVGFYAGEDSQCFHVLGGNQSNSVSITRIDKSRLQAIRWPKTGGEPVPGRVIRTATGEASRDEA
ncbi:TIGR02594 family protein [Sinorhizobium fredii]